MNIDAKQIEFRELNEKIKSTNGTVNIENCFGTRFIGAGMTANIVINGTPGNALGAYFDGGLIVVNGNAQDAVGDTMNDGQIIVHGNAGDALGYSMRGGSIFVKDNAGYRAGVHMKEYGYKKPVLVIGGNAGSFLGEYLAGGVIVVFGTVGNFLGTGMHGGKIFIKKENLPKTLSSQLKVKSITAEEKKQLKEYLQEYKKHFGKEVKTLPSPEDFCVLEASEKDQYRRLYATI